METALESVTPLLAQMGFKKRSGWLFTTELEPDVLGWLGLNRATEHRAKGEVEVNPVVGVRFQRVERLVAELRGEKFHGYIPPTINRPIGYLLPEAKYRGWIFGPGRANDTAKDMVSIVEKYGLPFMRSIRGLSELLQMLEARYGFDHLIMYRRPVTCFLAGDTAQARTLVEESLAAIGVREDLAAAEFRKFAAAFLNRLSSVPP